MQDSQDSPTGAIDRDLPELVREEMPPLPPRKRPMEYSDVERRTIVEWICAHVAEGGEGNTFRHWAKEAGISRGTLWKWTTEDKTLAAIWESARIWQAHSSVEDMLDLADTATAGKNGDVDKRRLQVDARKFFIVKVAPKIYGEKLEVAGPNGIPLLPPAPTRFDPSKLSTNELEDLEKLVSRGTVINVIEAPPPSLALPSGATTTTAGG